MVPTEDQGNRPPTVQTSNETGQGHSKRSLKRDIKPVHSQQHLETGRVEITTLPFQTQNKITNNITQDYYGKD